MKLQTYYVYVLMNDRNTVHYVGMTNNLDRRINEHRAGIIKGFTWQYNTDKLVYFETCDTAERAIAREKQLKNWHREWKMNLIRTTNPELLDLYDQIHEIPKRVRDDEE